MSNKTNTVTAPAVIADDRRRMQILGIPDDVAGPLAEYITRLNRWQCELAAERFPHMIRGWHDLSPADQPSPPAGELNRWFDLDPEHKGGGRYIRVVGMELRDGKPIVSSVHSFVEKATGDVYKPDGYKRPAKGVRYRLTDDSDEKKQGSRAQMLYRLDGYGSYLYAGR